MRTLTGDGSVVSGGGGRVAAPQRETAAAAEEEEDVAASISTACVCSVTCFHLYVDGHSCLHQTSPSRQRRRRRQQRRRGRGQTDDDDDAIIAAASSSTPLVTGGEEGELPPKNTFAEAHLRRRSIFVAIQSKARRWRVCRRSVTDTLVPCRRRRTQLLLLQGFRFIIGNGEPVLESLKER